MANNQNMQLKISVFNGVPWELDVPPDYTLTDFEDVCDLLSDVQVVQTEEEKDGKYFVVGLCVGSRSNANMEIIDGIVIDGDRAEGYSGCVPVNLVHVAMKDADVTHILHTSFSHNPAVNHNRWRLFVPVNGLTADNFNQCSMEIMGILHKAGLPVIPAKENKAISQAWYTPRCLPHMIDDFWFERFDTGERYNITGEEIPEQPESTFDRVKTSSAAFDLLKDGSAHTALMSLAGWYVKTTDWSNGQILDRLEIDILHCSDKKKIKRELENSSHRIKSKIKHCRKESLKAGADVKNEGWEGVMVSADQYPEKEYPPINWAVDNLIPEGMTIIAAAPKSGKSILAIDICCSIATGTSVMGAFNCTQGDSIYVSLEDNHRLVKERIGEQGGRFSKNMLVIREGFNRASKKDDTAEFINNLDRMLELKPNLRIVIFDTLGKTFEPKGSTENEYAFYYEIMTPCREWAHRNHLAIAFVHHAAKDTGVQRNNENDAILGSVALQAIPDALIVIKKHKKQDGDTNRGTVFVTTKETSDMVYQVQMSAESHRWELDADVVPEENITSGVQIVIADILRKNGGWMFRSEIIELYGVGANENTIASAIKRMVSIGAVAKEDNIAPKPGTKERNVYSLCMLAPGEEN